MAVGTALIISATTQSRDGGSKNETEDNNGVGEEEHEEQDEACEAQLLGGFHFVGLTLDNALYNKHARGEDNTLSVLQCIVPLGGGEWGFIG